VIKYIGSKRVLAPMIADIAQRTGARTAVDLFAGTTRVGQVLRARGIRVLSNDTASYSQVLGRAYIEADERLDRMRLRRLLEHLNALPGERGYVTETFCERSRYFQPRNGMRIDAIRAEIDRVAASDIEHAVLLASLLEAADRLVVVVDLVIDGAGNVQDVAAYRARIVNRAKLTYESVGLWLAGGPKPEEFAAIDGLEAQVRVQDELARRLRSRRHERGALDLETIEAQPVTSASGQVVDIAVTRKSRARDLIEDFMIAANAAIAGFLEARRVPSIRRVVRAPKRWPRLVELAKRYGESLPDEPSSLALATFLERRRAADPDAFADLSLSVVKLLGAGEYTVERPWEPDGEEGHFGLAVDDYSHTTAPNRRYADLVMQRLLKATLAGAPSPYTADELDVIAAHCTEMENAARKVERSMRKVVAATLLSHRIGETFDAIVTGVNQSGTFARLTHPPAEGRVVRGEHGLDVGDRVRVKLVEVDVEKGYIDFARV